MLNVYELPNIRNLKVHGRTTGCLRPLTLFWTGSSIELNVKASELWIELEAGYNEFEPWVSILINSFPISRFMLIKGKYWICIFRGMKDDVVKNVKIIKDSQAMNEDSGCFFSIHAVKSDGEFMPIEEKPYKIEFIGDSITSGEGAMGIKAEEDWIPMWFSAINNYTYITAQTLNAEYRIVSQSGWGVYTSWDNNPNCNIPRYYDKVCGLLSGENNVALGAHKEYDFLSWQPDIIVVNLGTNDESAYTQPEWKDEVTRKVCKQRLNTDGTFNKEDLNAFEEAILQFLIKLRRYNKAAHIVWAYGMLGNNLMPAVKRAVDKYVRTYGDMNVSVFELPNTTNETLGSRFHPGILSHKKAAKELSEYLNKLL